MKHLLFLGLFAASSLVLHAEATYTDVTDQYLSNASFENDSESSLQQVTNSADGLRGWTLAQPTGWTVSGTDVTVLLVSANCYADNNFGLLTTIPDGEHAYYLRMGWSTGSTTLSQTLKSLPAGQYQLSIRQRTGYANNATSSFSLSAGTESVSTSFTQGSASCFVSMAWQTTSLVFTTTETADVPFSLTIDWQSGGSCLMVDDVRLYRVEGEIVEPEDPTETEVNSPTEGVLTQDFVEEAAMMDDLLQMLANFTVYMKNDFQDCQYPNSINEECGAFKGENTMGNNEQGVRPNADLSMICAFLVKYGKDKVTLPTSVTWTDLETMAMKSLVFAYSTHKANKLKVCSGGNYWGSTSTSDCVWESSLWAMSVAYSAFFQWDKLSDTQKNYIYALLKAECNYELNRSIPTGYNGDTKAEENGWEADILAATLGLFPDDELASKWYDRLRAFAVNSYSHYSDKTNTSVPDPDYDSKTVADLYVGQNLYSDYTLQNHNYFHTSYQNVVMQELGEAALALKLFQTGLYNKESWATQTFMHHNQEVQDSVLNWLALADGELAMPNGNDWSLFLYDQITSYTTQACFQRDPNALLFENLAYKNIKARQTTTTDGSWLLNPDVGARRMGVEAHRVMMTWLMHHVCSTADLTPTSWDDFNERYADAKVFKTQNVVRAASDDRFVCFSWSKGLNSYTGYIAQNTVDQNKIIVPYRANNTGNFLGWYTVSGKSTNATPVVSGNYRLAANSFAMNGELNTNDASLNNRFLLYVTQGNAVIYLDYVRANNAVTITREQGGLMGISTDPFTREKRTLYAAESSDEITHKQLDGTTLTQFYTPWLNIDNQLGFVALGGDSCMAFGDRALNNSIQTSKLYTSYNNTSRTVKANEVVGRRGNIYYSRVTAEQTKALCEQSQMLTDKVPTGWNALLAADPSGRQYLAMANFRGTRSSCTLQNVTCPLGSPVFADSTTITPLGSTAKFQARTNHSCCQVLNVFVNIANELIAQLDSSAQSISPESALLTNRTATDQTAEVSIVSEGVVVSGTASVPAGYTIRVYVENGVLQQTTVSSADAISTIPSVKKAHAGVRYDLSGRPLNAVDIPRGIYIENGEKYLR